MKEKAKNSTSKQKSKAAETKKTETKPKTEWTGFLTLIVAKAKKQIKNKSKKINMLSI